jgi:Domain of unknown function (DUF5615)
VTGPGGDKPGALLLDEMFSPSIADGLAAQGIDCRAVVADALLRALSDLEIFEAAPLEDRVIVTNNVPDFESLRRARDAVGGLVPGLIYTSDVTFPARRPTCDGAGGRRCRARDGQPRRGAMAAVARLTL